MPLRRGLPHLRLPHLRHYTPLRGISSEALHTLRGISSEAARPPSDLAPHPSCCCLRRAAHARHAPRGPTTLHPVASLVPGGMYQGCIRVLTCSVSYRGPAMPSALCRVCHSDPLLHVRVQFCRWFFLFPHGCPFGPASGYRSSRRAPRQNAVCSSFPAPGARGRVPCRI